MLKSSVFSVVSSEKQRKAMLNLGLLFSQTNVMRTGRQQLLKSQKEWSEVCLGKSSADGSISVV